jgi:hypothetical protein
VIAQAAAALVEERKKYTGKSISYPTVEEIKAEVNSILDSPEIRSTVKCQLVPKYREKILDSSLDTSTKERKGEEWFDKNWNDENWRIRNCPGKEVLKRLRTWCQQTYGLTLTPPKLAATLHQLPDDVQEIMDKLQEYFYS